MRIEWVRSLQEIERHKLNWQNLQESVQNRTAYCMYEYVLAWYRAYAGSPLISGATPLVGLAWEGGQLVGVAPLTESMSTFSKVPVRRVDCAGANLSAGELLVHDHRTGVVEGFVDSLVSSEEFDVVLINGLPVEGERWRALMDFCQTSGWKAGALDFDSYAIADLSGGYESYNKSFGWKFRSRNKHVAKKVLEAGRVRIEEATSTDDELHASSIRNRMVSIQNKSERTRRGGLEVENVHHAFYNDLFATYGQRGAIDASILSINDLDVAFMFGFTERGIYYHTRMAFAEEHAAISPGKYLLQEVFRRIPDRGLHTVFSHGEYEYKTRWATSIVPQKTVCVFGRTVKARLASVALKAARVSGLANLILIPHAYTSSPDDLVTTAQAWWT